MGPTGKLTVKLVFMSETIFPIEIHCQLIKVYADESAACQKFVHRVENWWERHLQ
jgi:hypothetical protein